MNDDRTHECDGGEVREEDVSDEESLEVEIDAETTSLSSSNKRIMEMPIDRVRAGEEVSDEESLLVKNATKTTSVSSSNKRIKEMSIDRLSALPDSLIIHILSFLGLKTAAITAALSKRWRFLWADLPRIEFYERSSETEKIRKLVTRIHRILLIRSVRFVERFQVDFSYDETFDSDINAWVEYAVKNKVREVSLQLDSKQQDFYLLPQIMYSNPYLRELSLQGCIIDPGSTVDWKSLTSLRIEQVGLPQHVLEEILSGCPALERLYLDECWGFNCVETNSPNLQLLSVRDWETGTEDPLLEIAAPYIQHLHISFYPIDRKLLLRNISSVDSSYISFCGVDYNLGSVEVMNNAKEIFVNFLHVKELELEWTSFEVLSKLVADGWTLPQSRFRKLMLNASTYDYCFAGIFGLLKSSPILEELDIMAMALPEESIGWDPAAMGELDCDLSHLKTVHITDFSDEQGEPTLTMSRILLQRAQNLENLVVSIVGFTEYSSTPSIGLIDKIQVVGSYPRSSQNADVDIWY